MEDTLGEGHTIMKDNFVVVLILIMEDALGEQKIDLSDNQCFTSEIPQITPLFSQKLTHF